MAQARILIVEDEPLVALTLKREIGLAGHAVVGHASSADMALDLIKNLRPDCVTLDYNLAGIPATEVACLLSELKTAFILCTGNIEMAAKNLEVLPNAIIEKPFRAREVGDTIDRVMVHIDRARAANATIAAA